MPALSRASQITWSDPKPTIGGNKAPLEMPDGRLLVVRVPIENGVVRIEVAQRDPQSGEWSVIGKIAEGPDSIDMGDGHLVRLTDGRLWYAYRFNQYRGEHEGNRQYSIRISESRDEGKTWSAQSIVAQTQTGAHRAPGTSAHGLWAPSLLQLADGSVLCLYDDENAAHEHGEPWNQWLVSKRWDETSKTWSAFSVISGTKKPGDHCRDGMVSAVQLQSGRIIATFESPAPEAQRSVFIRSVHSDDNGKTWSWETGRDDVHRPSVPGALCVAPWIASLGGERLICVFVTDEDRPDRVRPGTPPDKMQNDLKYVMSDDGGQSWSEARLIYRSKRTTYLPGVLQLRHGPDAGKLFALAADADLGDVEVLGSPASHAEQPKPH